MGRVCVCEREKETEDERKDKGRINLAETDRYSFFTPIALRVRGWDAPALPLPPHGWASRTPRSLLCVAVSAASFALVRLRGETPRRSTMRQEFHAIIGWGPEHTADKARRAPTGRQTRRKAETSASPANYAIA